MEIWKSITDFNNYQISNYGRIKNTNTNKILSPADNGKGYLYINLSNNGIKKRFYIHRLVANAFIPNPHKLPLVNHKDENTHNNNSDNLEWCTNQYNITYGTCRERIMITQGQQIICVETGIKYPSIREAARQINRAHNNILIALQNPTKTCAGYHWQYVDAE